MNYYPFHIGDYLSATRHLTWEEDAAYRRLLDTYYTTEKPLPVEVRQVWRLVLAATESQREAVESVLREFFVLTDAGWINTRADNEIAAMRDKQQKQRDKANKRWQKPATEPGNASAMPRHQTDDATASKSDADAMPPTPTPTPTPTPIEPKGSLLAAKRRTRIAADFAPNETGLKLADEQGIDVESELRKFCDHHAAKGSTMADWQAAWRTWVGNARAFGGLRSVKPAVSFAQQDEQARRRRWEEMTGRKWPESGEVVTFDLAESETPLLTQRCL